MGRRDPESRFWSHVDKLGPRWSRHGRCYLWTGATNGRYGLFYRGGRVYAHRFAYGDVPDGLELDHLCQRTLCVRRSHLEAVTRPLHHRRTNERAGGHYNARKTHCKRGHLLANAYANPSGRRQCRICANLSAKNSRRRGSDRQQMADTNVEDDMT